MGMGKYKIGRYLKLRIMIFVGIWEMKSNDLKRKP